MIIVRQEKLLSEARVAMTPAREIELMKGTRPAGFKRTTPEIGEAHKRKLMNNF